MALKKKASVTPVTEKEEPVAKVQAKSKPVEKEVKKKKAAPAPMAEEVEEIEDAEIVEQAEEVEQDEVNKEAAPVTRTKQIAKPQARQVATASEKGVLAQAAEAGFEGLTIGFGSFPILKIENGSFDLDGEELEDKTVHLNIRQSRTKYLIKQAVSDDEDPEFIYSYDGVLDLSGNSVEDWKADQLRDGFKIETKEYVEAVAEILDEGDTKGDFCILSIPPSGRSRFSGYVAQLIAQRGVYPGSVITKAIVGKKITKNSKSWNPWSFKFHSMMEDYER